MKKTTRLLALMLMLILFAAVCCPISANAASEKDPLYFVLNASGDAIGIGYGIKAGSTRYFLCPDLNQEHTLVNGDDTNIAFKVQKGDSWEDYFAFYRTVEGSKNESSVGWFSCASPRENESIIILYFTGDGLNTVDARVTGNAEALSGDGDWLISLSCPNGAALQYPDVAPWIAFNANAECVGAVVKKSGGYYLFTQWYSKGGSASPSTPSPQAPVAPAIMTEYESIKLDPDAMKQDKSKLPLYIGIGVVATFVVAAIVVAVVMLSKSKTGGGSGHGRAGGGGTEYRPSPAYPTKRLYLACRGGYQEGRMYPLQGTIRIGRGDDCSIQYPIEQPGVSRHHVTIRCQQEMGRTRVWLEDTSSMGTYLQRVSAGETQPNKMQAYTPIELHPGDVFYLAQRANKYEIVEQ